jgi:hypothetical protein
VDIFDAVSERENVYISLASSSHAAKKKAAHDDGTANLTSLSIVVPHGAAHKGNQIQATKSGHHPEEAIQMPLV